MAYINKTTKTQKKLESALLSLMIKKKFDSITINDITDLADVNRSTFYRHYLDKYDLLEKIENSILNDLSVFYSNISNEVPTKLPKDFELRDYISSKNNFFVLLQNHLATIKILLSTNGSPTFQKSLSQELRKIFKKSISLAQPNISKTQNELLYNFLAGTIVNNLYYWTEHQELTPDELFNFSINIMSNGVVNFIKENMA